MLIAFGPFELDTVACELRRDGRHVAMQPRVFDTLHYLIEHRDRIVSKKELLDALWTGQQLNPVAIPWSVSHARKALGQRAGQQTFIRTFPRRGYRFVAQMRTPDDAQASTLPVSVNSVLSRTPFVGRERGLLQLTSALGDAAAGGGALLLLIGEAGIGKTRCAAEFEAAASEEGVTAWVGRCVDHGAAPACWPFIQILRAGCNDPSVPVAGRRAMRHLLRELEPVGPEPQASCTEPARFWFLDRIGRVLLSAASKRTRLIIIDDLHCADESTLRALAMLSPLLSRARILVVATARIVSGDGAGHDVAALIFRLRPHEAITLAALTAEDVAAYLHMALDQAPGPELTRAVHTRTGGNPLFMSEVVRAALARQSGDGSLRPDDVPLPSAARDFVHQRLARLDEQTRDVLDAASVIGDRFPVRLLQRTCGLPSQELLSRLDDAAAAGVLESHSGLNYCFVHPLLRELSYGALSVARRAELHARVGLALESSSLLEPNVQRLAYHFHAALGTEYGERIERYARLAGDAAMRVYAYEEAADFYSWALEARPAGTVNDLASLGELLLKYAAALMLTGQHDTARAHCEQAMAIAREAHAPELLVEAVRVLRATITGPLVPDDIALAALEEARACLPDSAIRARARTYIQLASIPPYASSSEESRRMCDEGLRLARECGDRALELAGLRARMHTVSGPDTTDELLVLAEQLLDAESGPTPWLALDAHMARYFTFLRAGRAGAAESALAAFGKAAQALRLREWEWQYQRLLAHRMFDAGSIDDATQRFDQLLSEGRALGLRYAPAVYALQRHMVSQASGAVSSASNGSLWRWAHAIPSYRAWRVRRRIESGDRLQARQEFDELVQDGCAAVPRDSAFLYTLAELANAALELADHDAERMLQGLLTPYADRIAISDLPLSLGSISHQLGMLARAFGDGERARDYFEAAQRVNAATGHQLHAQRSRLSLAELALEGSTTGPDRIRAKTIALEVREAARHHGAGALRSAADALLERFSPSRDRRASQRAGYKGRPSSATRL